MLSVWFHLHSLSLTSGTVKVRSGLQSNLGPGDCSSEEAALAPGGCLWRSNRVSWAPALPTPDINRLNTFSCHHTFKFSVVYFCKADKAQPQEIKGAQFHHCSGWLVWVTERGDLRVHGLGSG